MTVLGWIVLASIAGGTLSAVLAAFSLLLRATWVPVLVSYAIGALLGAAFLEVLPHAFEAGDAHEVGLAILGGIVGFFLFEKLLLWRHCHSEDEASAGHDHGRTGAMIIMGDTIHNFVDGVLIAAAFVQSTELGIITAIAIVAHEIPQEVGDFLILLHSGYSRTKALALNLASSLATIVGGVLGYYSLQEIKNLEPVLLGVVGASMVYVAVADLIPGLHKRAELRATFVQISLIGLGVGSIWLVRAAVGGH